MTQFPSQKTEALLTFANIDTSIGHDQRALFAPAAKKEVKEISIQLNDARSDSKIVQGAEGLDVQGFAYLRHKSALQEDDQWFAGQNIEEIYFPEICDLVCKTTGAKKAIIVNSVFRRKAVTLGLDPKFYVQRGSDIDKAIAKIPRDRALVMDRQEPFQQEPIRGVHIDYTELGLHNTIRGCRKDITKLAAPTIAAEDARALGKTVNVPRYSSYLVWRPLKTVKRDPLVVCDYRTIEKDTLSKHAYRCPSEQNENGEYLMEYWNVDIPKDEEKAQWYWMPEQTVEDVLLIKLADSAAGEVKGGKKGVARCGPHSSADVKGTEDEETRESVECRVIAFWE